MREGNYGLWLGSSSLSLYTQRELVRGNTRIAYSTRKAYEGYLNASCSR
jgi:hypothetical protein